MNVYTKVQDGIWIGVLVFIGNGQWVNVFQNFGTDKYRDLKHPLKDADGTLYGENFKIMDWDDLGLHAYEAETGVVAYTMPQFYRTLKRKYPGTLDGYYGSYVNRLLSLNREKDIGVEYWGEEWRGFEVGIRYLVRSWRHQFNRIEVKLVDMYNAETWVDLGDLVVKA